MTEYEERKLRTFGPQKKIQLDEKISLTNPAGEPSKVIVSGIHAEMFHEEMNEFHDLIHALEHNEIDELIFDLSSLPKSYLDDALFAMDASTMMGFSSTKYVGVTLNDIPERERVIFKRFVPSMYDTIEDAL